MNTKLKIGLWGYGKMGVEIEKIALVRGHEIVWKLTSKDDFSSIENIPVNAVIDFTQPDVALQHIQIAIEKGWNLVMGTTGWYEEVEKVRNTVLKSNAAFLYASNFSVGVNIAFKINEILAKLMTQQDQYACKIDEIHHTQKLDEPSGTAITFAEGILKNHKKYKDWRLNENKPGTLPVYAHREGDVKDTHMVSYESEIDTITLKHEAHNRKGFALGSVIAAEWLQGKKGFFTMTDVLN